MKNETWRCVDRVVQLETSISKYKCLEIEMSLESASLNKKARLALF